MKLNVRLTHFFIFHIPLTVTLEGIRYVVDCGKHKTRDFNGTTGMESLMVQDISKAQVGDIRLLASSLRLYRGQILTSLALLAYK